MCGILVKVGNSDDSSFIEALNLQILRGPDSSGFTRIGNIRFGHRRLKIIDLSKISDQPMQDLNERYTIVFNGEIYNFREIKDELISLGYKFKTDGDTEVILNAYDAFGPNAIDRFIGMFSFVIYDIIKNCLFVARDRLGVKPLFYTQNENEFCFSSEIKSILKFDEKKRKLNLRAVSSYLSYRYPINNETFFEGINVFPPGHWMNIDLTNNTSSIQKYWDLHEQFKFQKVDKGEAFYLRKLKELIESSVKYRMISDVPVGAYLSGGVDSSIVTYEMSKLSKEQIKTYTIGFPDNGFNEFSYSKLVSNHCNTIHKEILLGEQGYFSAMEELISFKDAPLGVPNEVPLYLMSKELKKDVTVVLSGEGADEIMLGYSRIFSSTEDLNKILDPDIDDEILTKLFKKYGKDLPITEVSHFLSLYQYCSSSFKSNLFHKNVDSEKIENELNSVFEEKFKIIEGESYLNKMMYCFETIHLPGLLNRLDVTTMAASVEGRVPFVDHRLVEFACSVPNHYKLKWKEDLEILKNKLGDEMAEIFNTPKSLLKKSYEKCLPHEILYRKKMGFPVPLDNWMGTDFKQLAYNKIVDGYLVNNKLIDKTFFEQLIKDYEENKNDIGMKIWMIFNLELFVSKYF